ncbi:MAG: tetratricopeptide repeat protein [Alphaproteobacteria bacterium]|jgi:tetratricopeptide (TPR) repeat protein|nr:tetratricopeptide repeat protein [Alphaproteobacteria bacterium]
MKWVSPGSARANRPPARHCTALALIALEHYEEGAARLEELANASDAGTMETRALYLAQAGNAWLASGLPEAAVTTLENANRINPGDADLIIDLAAAYLARGQWREASGLLGEALETRPGDPEALALRARALMEMGRLKAALADVRAARLTAPKDIDLLVLRGEIREARRLSR